MSGRRLLFASCHGYVDPTSGAAWATRDLLELLAACGVECRVVSTCIFDHDRQTPPGPILQSLGVSAEPATVPLAGDERVKAYRFDLGGVDVTLQATASSLIRHSFAPSEAQGFLALVENALDQFRPDVLLTYGGHPVNLAMMSRARRRGVPVVFHLHNLSYDDRRVFTDATAVLVPSEYSRRHYARMLGLECVAIPCPVIPARVLAPKPEPRFLTFVNPLPAKGASVFARIAVELQARRPEIELLVVDSRGTGEGLMGVPLDLSELRNMQRIANTNSPRAIYRITRALLMPSLVRESFGRVAAEGLANGIPVLASDRGALPETLGDAGFVFTLPEACTPTSATVPTARDVAPWLATIERLWDDAAWEAAQRTRALEAAQRFALDTLMVPYMSFLGSFSRSPWVGTDRRQDVSNGS